MYCALGAVLCTAVSCVLCTMFCTVYCVLCTVYCVLCTVYCVLCTVYCVLCTVVCTVYCVLCTVYCTVRHLGVKDRLGHRAPAHNSKREELLACSFIVDVNVKEEDVVSEMRGEQRGGAINNLERLASGWLAPSHPRRLLRPRIAVVAAAAAAAAGVAALVDAGQSSTRSSPPF